MKETQIFHTILSNIKQSEFLNGNFPSLLTHPAPGLFFFAAFTAVIRLGLSSYYFYKSKIRQNTQIIDILTNAAQIILLISALVTTALTSAILFVAANFLDTIRNISFYIFVSIQLRQLGENLKKSKLELERAQWKAAALISGLTTLGIIFAVLFPHFTIFASFSFVSFAALSGATWSGIISIIMNSVGILIWASANKLSMQQPTIKKTIFENKPSMSKPEKYVRLPASKIEPGSNNSDLPTASAPSPSQSISAENEQKDKFRRNSIEQNSCSTNTSNTSAIVQEIPQILNSNPEHQPAIHVEAKIQQAINSSLIQSKESIIDLEELSGYFSEIPNELRYLTLLQNCMRNKTRNLDSSTSIESDIKKFINPKTPRAKNLKAQVLDWIINKNSIQAERLIKEIENYKKFLHDGKKNILLNKIEALRKTNCLEYNNENKENCLNLLNKILIDLQEIENNKGEKILGIKFTSENKEEIISIKEIEKNLRNAPRIFSHDSHVEVYDLLSLIKEVLLWIKKPLYLTNHQNLTKDFVLMRVNKSLEKNTSKELEQLREFISSISYLDETQQYAFTLTLAKENNPYKKDIEIFHICSNAEFLNIYFHQEFSSLKEDCYELYNLVSDWTLSGAPGCIKKESKNLNDFFSQQNARKKPKLERQNASVDLRKLILADSSNISIIGRKSPSMRKIF